MIDELRTSADAVWLGLPPRLLIQQLVQHAQSPKTPGHGGRVVILLWFLKMNLLLGSVEKSIEK